MDRQDDEFELPPELKKDLEGIYKPPRGFGGDDGRILAAARAAGARQTRRWRWAVGVGIAAAVALAGTLWVVGHGAMERDSGAVPGAVGYVRTGDIRDAFYVARQLKAHRALEARWDVNGDGVVDEKDAKVLAAAAVRLSGKGMVQ